MQNKPLEATEGETQWGQGLDIAEKAGEKCGGGIRTVVWQKGECRVLSEELVEKVETESDIGEKNNL